MSEIRYPNESAGYRTAREALLLEEKELVEKVRFVADKRRELPLGGILKKDYKFKWATDSKLGKDVKFSELFGGKDSLLIYSFMYGPSGDSPCHKQYGICLEIN